MKTKTILFIHGMWGGGWYFEQFRTYFQELGYKCLTPDLRYHDVSPDTFYPAVALRRRRSSEPISQYCGRSPKTKVYAKFREMPEHVRQYFPTFRVASCCLKI